MKTSWQKTFLLIFLSLCFLSSYAVTLSDPSKIIQISPKNSLVTIRLASNPTTGYSWIMKKYNKTYLKLVRHEYVRPQPQTIGAGGYEEWVFQARPAAFKKSTTVKLTFVYARPWEKNFVKKAVFQLQS